VVVAFFVIMTPKRFPTKAALVIANPKSKLLDQVREVLRVKHYSLRTEEAYVQWARRYLKFHRDAAGTWRHPRDLGPAEVVAFLNHLANGEHVAAGTQNQALNAILFLYGQVLGQELGDLGGFLRASKARWVPVVLGRAETDKLLTSLEGTWRLMAQLLYGSGLRLLELLRLRVKGIFEHPSERARVYDLEERRLDYSVRIIRLVEALPHTRAGNHVAGQLLRSGRGCLGTR
jgi:integrase